MAQERIAWHPGFVGALQLELLHYVQYLSYTPESQLSDEPLKMDLLVIKKAQDVVIEKNIGRFFRGHNIFEYKSPSDSLTVNDYYKVLGYALLYKALRDVAISDITVSLVSTNHPRKLLTHLRRERLLSVTPLEAGIYAINGELLPVQIIEAQQLNEEENQWLKNLNRELNTASLLRVMEKPDKEEALVPLRMYVSVVLQANAERVKEVFRMGKARLKEVLVEAVIEQGLSHIFEEKALEKGLEKGREEGREEGREKGREEGLIPLKKLYFMHRLSQKDTFAALAESFTPDEAQALLSAWDRERPQDQEDPSQDNTN